MDGAITWQVIVSVGGFLLAVIGLGFGFWKYFEGKIERAKTDAALATETVKLKTDIIQRELSEHKVHSAETFATKSGLAESLTRVHDALDRLSDRIDTLIQQGSKSGPK